MKLWNPFRKKESLAGAAISQFVEGQAIYTPREYGALSKEGYMKNVIAYRCINMIADSIGSVPWMLFKGQQEQENHDVLKLLAKPNPQVGFSQFMQQLSAFMMIAGNSYVEAARMSDTRPPTELWNLRPDRMKIIGGKMGMPQAFRYDANGKQVDYPVNPINGKCNVYHMKLFHPIDDWYGLAPIEAGAFSIDQHNAAGNHNASLLQNRAVPSGAVIIKTQIGDKELARVQQMMIDRYNSPKNAGKTMVFGGDVDWKEMGLSPKEMDYNDSLLGVARDICAAFGVPHVLIVPGQSTYRNMEEARLMFWEETIIPLLRKIGESFFPWLLDFYGAGYTMRYDLDGISALIPRRVQHRDAVSMEYTSGLITRDEARAALQYEPAERDGDKYFNEAAQSADPAADTSVPKKSVVITNKKDYVNTLFSFAAPDEIDDPTLSANVTTFLSGVFSKMVRKHGEEVIREIGNKITFEANHAVENYVEETTGNLIRNVNETTKKRIRQQIGAAFDANESIGEMRERIEKVFTEASTTRATMIATTEATRITGFASETAIDQSGVDYKEWLATMDGHTRDAHAAMDGQVVSAGAKFHAPGGATADFPGGFGIARLDINCRCAIAAAYPEKSAKARTDAERRDLWQLREKSRRGVEKEIMESFQKIFTMQREAVMKRITALLGGL